MRVGAISFAVLACLCAGCVLKTRPPVDPFGKGSRCEASGGQVHSLLVEWPSMNRAALEALAKHGAVVVRYSGCEMELLARCQAPGSYRYIELSPKREQISIKDENALYANMPIGAASLSGRLHSGDELAVDLRIVGQYEMDRHELDSAAFTGNC